MAEIIVAKIGGSTLGSYDTALADVVELQRRGLRPVVVHGGGSLISEWLALHNLPTRFEGGLRVTDEESLKVVVAVLAGLVNKRIVASLCSLGGAAVGLSGADGGLMGTRLADQRLGLVGEVTGVEVAVLATLWHSGLIPVIAPIGVLWDGERPTAQLVNVNADEVAGSVAAAIDGACRLVFLTDVPGIQLDNDRIAARLEPAEAVNLIESGVIRGGMIPKVRACLRAAQEGARTLIVDGRVEHALVRAIEGNMPGTTIA